MDFEKALEEWLAGAQRIIDEYTAANFKNLLPDKLTIVRGKRYIKVIRDHSVFAFIDKNGDVLKPASWATPAKHARGNLFDETKGLGSMGPYGPAYLR